MKVLGLNKKLLSLLIVLTLLIGNFSAVAVFADGHEVEIYILHTNDMHGRVSEGAFDGMGFDRIAALANAFRAEHEHVLLLDAGDTVHGMPIATLDQGASIVRIMNAMGYDAMAPGNHDFNYGQERLLALDELSDFPILAANVVYEETGEYYLPPYTIIEMNGLSVGIFGLATPETLYKSHPAGTVGLKFIEPAIAAQAMVDELGPQVDVLIALSHLGIDESSAYEDTSIAVAELVEGIDLIVDGHSHTELPEGRLVNGTLIVMAQEYNKHLGVVKITIHTDGEKTLEASLLSKEYAMTLDPDPEVSAIIDEVKEAQTAILSVVVGKTDVHLDGEREQVRAGETNLGNLITDAMLWMTGADFAFTNGGGMRTSIHEGDITRENIIAVLPFGNVIVTHLVSGADVLAALEVASAGYPAPAGNFAHVAGLTYTIDPNMPVGERVSDVMISGVALDLEANYNMATNDFLAAGGDGMSMFVDTPQTGAFAAMDEALIQYIEATGTVMSTVEGRINIVALEEVEEPAEEVIEYVVVAGDVLWRIAQKYGHTWEHLAEYNELANPHLILIGQKLMIPVKN